MDESRERSHRDRALWVVRLATFGSLAGAVGITWVFSDLAEAYFSGVSPTPSPPPKVPVAATPQQAAPAVVRTVVHHPAQAPVGQRPAGAVPPAPGAAPGPRPPVQAPAAAPPPPPPPACHSTPSKPC